MDFTATFRIALRAPAQPAPLVSDRSRRHHRRGRRDCHGGPRQRGPTRHRTADGTVRDECPDDLRGICGDRRTAGGMGSLPTLTLDDAKAIEKEVSSVSLVTATVRTQVVAVYGNQNWTTSAFGVTPEFAAVRQWTVAAGRFINQTDMEGRRGSVSWVRPSRGTSSETPIPWARRSGSRTCP